jgi:hypothetical protein
MDAKAASKPSSLLTFKDTSYNPIVLQLVAGKLVADVLEISHSFCPSGNLLAE